MKGLDLRKFSKIKEDKKSAILKHPDGHEIKIAKDSISKSLRDQLEGLSTEMYGGGDVKGFYANSLKGIHENALKGKSGESDAGHILRGKKEHPESKFYRLAPEPKYLHEQKLKELKSMKKPELMAHGGEVKKTHIPDNSIQQVQADKAGHKPWCKCEEKPGDNPFCRIHSDKPVKMSDGTDPGNPSQAPLEISPIDPNSPEGASVAGIEPQYGQTQARAPSSMSQQQSYPAIEPEEPQQAPATQPNDVVPNAENQYKMWENDRANGHIEPKKLNDYFSNASVPGKLGMIFGALAGGIGSGLTHQPSAFLSLMQKQIDNDMEAQKSSKTNAYNANLLAQHQQMQEAQIKKMAVDNGWTAAQTKVALNNNAIQMDAFHRAVKGREFADNMLKETLAMPEGPAKEARKQAITLLYNALNTDNHNMFTRANAATVLSQEPHTETQETPPLGSNQPQGGSPVGGASAGQAAPQSQMPPATQILKPNADQKYKQLFATSGMRTPEQQHEIALQYHRAVQTDKALQQIDQLYPQLVGKATWGGYLSNKVNPHVIGGLAATAVEGMGAAAAPGTLGASLLAAAPAAIASGALGEAAGHGIKQTLRAVGGQTETQYETAKASLEGYIGSALAGVKVTPTEIHDLSEKFTPTKMDSEATARDKLQKLKEKIVTLTETSALDSAGMTNKRR